MKSKIAFLVTLASVCFLTACGSVNKPETPAPATSDSTAQTTDSTAQSKEAFAAGFVDGIINSTLKTSVEASDAETIASVKARQAASKGKVSSDGFTIHNDPEKGLKINMGIGFTAMKPQIFYKFFFTDYCVAPPASSGDETQEDCASTVTGALKIAIAYNGSTKDPQLGLILNTDDSLVFTDANGGMMDGTTLDFKQFTLWFSLTDKNDPLKSMSGTVAVNGMVIDLAMFEGLDLEGLMSGDISGLLSKLTASQYLPELMDSLLGSFVTSSGQASAISTYVKSPAGKAKAVPSTIKIFSDSEKGIDVTMGYSTKPLGAYFLFAFDDYSAPMPGSEEPSTVAVTGDLRISIVYRIKNLQSQMGLIINTDEPLVLTDSEGGLLDGSTMEFENMTMWFSLKDKNDPLKEMSGKAILNGMELDLAMFESLDILSLLSQFK